MSSFRNSPVKENTYEKMKGKYRFRDEVRVGETIVVCIDTDRIDPDDSVFSRNIFAFDRQGNMLWQVEQSGDSLIDSRTIDPGGDRNKELEIPVGFTYLHRLSDGTIVANTQTGFRYSIDIENGDIEYHDFVKS